MDDGYIYGHFMIRGEYIGNEKKKKTVWYSQGYVLEQKDGGGKGKD